MAKHQKSGLPPSKSEGNKFDKILKENLEPLIPVLLRKVIGLKNFRLENLPQIRQQTTVEREPDFLFRIFDEKTPDGRILHGEFEAKDDEDTVYRMAEYFGIILRRHRIEIEQHLFYLLKDKPRKIKNELRFENQYLRFHVHHVAELDYEIFIHSTIPEEVLLSILASPKDKKPAEIIRLILERLVQLKGDSLATRKFIQQLQVLSMLRNLHGETIKQVKNMVLSEEIIKQMKQDPLFVSGLEEGIEKGKEGKAVTGVCHMTDKGFDAKTIAEILEEPLAFVKKIQQQITKKEEIRRELEKRGTDAEKIAKKLGVSPYVVTFLKKGKDK